MHVLAGAAAGGQVTGGLSPLYTSASSSFGAAVGLANGYLYIGDPGCQAVGRGLR